MMTVHKSRGSTKKLGPISIGNKIVRFRIPSIERRFTVHEDLICRTSTLFKKELQNNRKIVEHAAEAEECCICQEVLDPTIKDIAYCVKCGQDIHDCCIEQWKRSSTTPIKPGAVRPLPKCPMCRADWKTEPLIKSLALNDKLDAEAVQRYLDWLYSGLLHIPATMSRKTEVFNLALIKCWAVAITMEDKCFKNVVVRTFFSEVTAQFWFESVRWAFANGGAKDEIKEFVIDVFMSDMEAGWFSKDGHNWPTEFVMVLADRALDGAARRSYDQVQKDWTKKLQMEDEEVDEGDEEATGELGHAADDRYRTEKAKKCFDNAKLSAYTSSRNKRRDDHDQRENTTIGAKLESIKMRVADLTRGCAAYDQSR
ncbi:hypothetical protein HBI45_223650 [Parastagonospora nodorum]|nr:hypothetical protein HBI45_223650 [Parastagonospora nodorum]